MDFRPVSAVMPAFPRSAISPAMAPSVSAPVLRFRQQTRSRLSFSPCRRRIDAGAMHEAAQRLIGRHDFSTFRAAECQANSPVRTLDFFHVTQDGDYIDIRASARSFLHHQVRSLVGSLEHVGSGKWTADDLEDALHARDRARCGVVAPACGLFLMSVDYGEQPVS